jgi:hydrogenase-4 component B
MSIHLLLISVAVVAFSGVPGLFLTRKSDLGQWIASILNVIGAVLAGVALTLHYVNTGGANRISMSWSLPLGQFAVAVDDLSLIFLIPIFLIPALGSIYGLSYWKQAEHAGNGRKLALSWGLLTAGMALVVLARDGVLLLMAWEVMALAGFFLTTTEENKPEVRAAGWVYLVATHMGTLCLLGFFALLRHATGSYDLWPSPAAFSPHVAGWIFGLGVVGFGLKAGIMPLHVWLPGAHANAPSHVSAIFSGVMLKAGVYGLIRVAGLTDHPPVWWGGTLLIAGTLSAVFAIAFAGAQRDIKRLLAYSSIENVGIIVMGIGLAALGRSLDRSDWVVLGLAGALLHVLNHSLFKPLLFFGAGNILHATHSREMDLLGGLGKKMPRTFVLWVIGAVAICGLPPLNGFVSELFVYIGLFRTAIAASVGSGWAALAAPALALVGAIAVATFVKVLGAVFAGSPRSAHGTHAHDPDLKMLAPMWIIAGCCGAIGVLPAIMIPLLNRAITTWSADIRVPATNVAGYLPIGWITVIAMLLLALATAGTVWFASRVATRSARAAGTWDCGYARPTARIQYTGSSFSQMVVGLFSWVLWPRRKSPQVTGAFAKSADFKCDVPDVVLDRGLLPAFGSAEWLLGWARIFQRGPIQVYLVYVLGILLMLLLFA